MNPKVALLLKAKKILKERGWARNKYENGDGNVCILGAMGLAEGKGSSAAEISNTLTFQISKDESKKGNGALHSWNDYQADSMDSVLNKLQSLAEKYSLEEV
jgi:hypothetical protein